MKRIIYFLFTISSYMCFGQENISTLDLYQVGDYYKKVLIFYNGKPFTGVSLGGIGDGEHFANYYKTEGSEQGWTNYDNRSRGIYLSDISNKTVPTMTTTWKNGIKDGPSQSYHRGGKIASKQNYENGIKNGLYESFYENGNIDERVVFKMGKEDGLYESFHENGTLRRKVNFLNGLYTGVHKSFYKDGKLEELKTYVIKPHPNNKKELSFFEEGLQERYYDNGQLEYKGVYTTNYNTRDIILNGPFESYTKDGKLIKKFTEYKGVTIGPYIEYFVKNEMLQRDDWIGTDQLSFKCFYKLNPDKKSSVIDGPFEAYHANGQLEAKGAFIMGKRTGLLERYSEDGKVIEKQIYINGKVK